MDIFTAFFTFLTTLLTTPPKLFGEIFNAIAALFRPMMVVGLVLACGSAVGCGGTRIAKIGHAGTTPVVKINTGFDMEIYPLEMEFEQSETPEAGEPE